MNPIEFGKKTLPKNTFNIKALVYFQNGEYSNRNVSSYLCSKVL